MTPFWVNPVRQLLVVTAIAAAGVVVQVSRGTTAVPPLVDVSTVKLRVCE